MTKALSEDTKQQMFVKCREKIRELRRGIGLAFIELGRYCCIVLDNKLYETAGLVSFEQWIADPEEGPAIGRRNVYNFMKLYRLGVFLQKKYGIDITIFLDIGPKKLVYLTPHIQKAIARNDKKAIVELLESGAVLPTKLLKREVSGQVVITGEADYRCVTMFGKDPVITLHIKKFSGELSELDDKQVTFTIKGVIEDDETREAREQQISAGDISQ